jgi:hypothetical protein
MGTVGGIYVAMIRFESGAGLLPPIRAGGGAPHPVSRQPHISLRHCCRVTAGGISPCHTRTQSLLRLNVLIKKHHSTKQDIIAAAIHKYALELGIEYNDQY